MKRVKAACICQTLHFLRKDGISSEQGRQRLRTELQAYKNGLDRNRTKYRILEETELPDGSIQIKIIKQYNATPVGDYLN